MLMYCVSVVEILPPDLTGYWRYKHSTPQVCTLALCLRKPNCFEASIFFRRSFLNEFAKIAQKHVSCMELLVLLLDDLCVGAATWRRKIINGAFISRSSLRWVASLGETRQMIFRYTWSFLSVITSDRGDVKARSASEVNNAAVYYIRNRGINCDY